MKEASIFIAFLALFTLLIPLLALDLPESSPVREPEIHSPILPAGGTTSGISQSETEESPDPVVSQAAPVSLRGVESFQVLDRSTGKVSKIPLREFLRGAVAAEMPVSFHDEALKAQAVAAHTFALQSHLLQQKSPDPALKGADFAADPQNREVYIPEKQALALFGDDSPDWKKICSAADSVSSYILTYGEEPIVAAYHAISCGQTEDAAFVWSGGAPYLKPVESPGDLLAPGYESSAIFSRGEVEGLLRRAYPEIELPDSPSDWFGQADCSGSGYVRSISAGGQELSGKEIRQLFGLRSHAFEVSYSDDGFTFFVRGYGHGVGLSQYGADFMARQGHSFDEILSAYYTGAILRQVSLEA